MALEVEYMMEYQNPGLPVTGHPLTAKVPDRGSFLALCLFVCEQDNSKTDRWILIKFSGYVQNGKRKI